jgi:hypothetical protein
LRPFLVLWDSVGHIGSAIRAVEEFERARGLSKERTMRADPRATGIPL